MGQDRSEVTEQVVKFPPKQQSGNPADEAGQAVIAQMDIRQPGLHDEPASGLDTRSTYSRRQLLASAAIAASRVAA